MGAWHCTIDHDSSHRMTSVCCCISRWRRPDRPRKRGSGSKGKIWTKPWKITIFNGKIHYFYGHVQYCSVAMLVYQRVYNMFDFCRCNYCGYVLLHSMNRFIHIISMINLYQLWCIFTTFKLVQSFLLVEVATHSIFPLGLSQTRQA